MGIKFHKGMKKPEGSGRKKGTPNKKKLIKAVDFLSEKDINPVQKILDLIPLLDAKEAVDAWFDLLSYCQGKPKEVEEEKGLVDPEDFEEVTTEDLLKLVKPDGA